MKINKSEFTRLIDNGVFCSAPFIQEMVNSDGQHQFCCEHNRHDTRRPQNFNDDYYVEIRNNMINGEQSIACTKCYDIEKVGGKSTRQVENQFLLSNLDDIEYIDTGTGTNLGHPIKFDLRMNNLCNLRCVMCTPHASALLSKTVAQNPDMIKMYGDPVEVDVTKSTFDATSDKLQNAREVRLLGGEPFLQPQVFEVLDTLIELEKHDTTITISTNGTLMNAEICKKLAYFDKVHVMFSIDGIGKTIEYIRNPSKWDNINKNIQQFLQYDFGSSSVTVGIHQTISIFNIFECMSVYEWVMDMLLPQDKSNMISRQRPVSYGFVSHPAAYNPQILPDAYKKKAIAHINQYDYQYSDSIVNMLTSGNEDSILLERFKKRTKLLDSIYKQSINDISIVSNLINEI